MAKTTKEKEGNQAEKSKFEQKLNELEKKFGVGTIIHGTDISEEIEVISTGSLTLDIATGIGGYPIGKLIEVYSFESCGKSTLSLHAIANFQKIEGECILIDFEQSFDKSYAIALGVDVDKLTVVQANSMEEGYNIIEELIKTGDVRLIILDSHTSMMPKKVVDGEVGDVTIGLQARINSQALGKIKPLLKPNRCTMIANSQLRVAVGNYGDPNIATGGLSYRFYSDMRLKITKSLDKEKELNKTTVEVIKNKCAVPGGKAVFNIDWGKGINRMQEIISIAVEFKLLTRGGAGWYTISEDVKIQGDEKMEQFLADNPEFAQMLEQDVIQKIKEVG